MLLVLVIFIMSTYIFHECYKFDKRDPMKMEAEKVLINRVSLNGGILMTTSKVRMKLFKAALIQFNPYLNLMLITNRFLSRAVRNTFLQIYFMLVSLLSLLLCYHDSTQFVSKEQTSGLGLTLPNQLLTVIVSLALITFLKPLIWKVVIKMFYEPDAKVQSFGDDVAITSAKKNIVQSQSMYSFEKNGNNFGEVIERGNDEENQPPLNAFNKQSILRPS